MIVVFFFFVKSKVKDDTVESKITGEISDHLKNLNSAINLKLDVGEIMRRMMDD